MERNFKESMRWLHTWSGLIVGWLLFAIFVTGTSSYYKDEINIWMKPEFHKAVVSDNAMQIAITKAVENAKVSNKVDVTLPNSRSNLISIRAEKPQQTKEKNKKRRTPSTYYDASTGEKIKETTKTAGGNFLYRFHFELHGVSRYLGRWIVGIATMAMLVAIITGILIHKRIFKDIFTFRPKNNTRGWMDAHILPAVAALPFLIMITYSGLVLFGNIMFPQSMNTYYNGNFMKYRQDMFALNSEKNTNIQTKVDEVINKTNSTRIVNTNTQRSLNKYNNSNASKILRTKAVRQINKIKQNNLLANEISSEKLFKIIAKANNVWPENIGGFTILKEKEKYLVEVTTKNPTTIFSTRFSKESITYDTNTAEVVKQTTPPTTKSNILNTSTAFRALHEAKFADSTLRLFFFLSGVLGTVIAGTGLILWIEKRKKRNLNKKSFGFFLVEKLNLGTIMGLFIAIGVFFIANRVITVDENTRRATEINIFFITWLLSYIYAFARNTSKAWKEQLLFATIIFALLPFINAFTVFDSFSQIYNRDNIFIYFDIFSFLLAGVFILIRFILSRIERRKA